MESQSKRGTLCACMENIHLIEMILQGDVWEVYQDIASYLLQATSDYVSGRRKKHSALTPPVHKTTSQILHVRLIITIN